MKPMDRDRSAPSELGAEVEARPLRPPRPGTRYIKVPFRGVVIADDALRRKVDGFFHRPMMSPDA